MVLMRNRGLKSQNDTCSLGEREHQLPLNPEAVLPCPWDLSTNKLRSMSFSNIPAAALIHREGGQNQSKQTSQVKEMEARAHQLLFLSHLPPFFFSSCCHNGLSETELTLTIFPFMWIKSLSFLSRELPF